MQKPRQETTVQAVQEYNQFHRSQINKPQQCNAAESAVKYYRLFQKQRRQDTAAYYSNDLVLATPQHKALGTTVKEKHRQNKTIQKSTMKITAGEKLL